MASEVTDDCTLMKQWSEICLEYIYIVAPFHNLFLSQPQTYTALRHLLYNSPIYTPSNISTAFDMHLLPTLVLGALVLTIHAGPIHKKPRQGTSLTSLPASDPDPVGRAAGVANKKAGYQYAPSLLGNGSFFLGGTLGDARVQSDIQLAVVDQTTQNNAIAIDAAAVQAAVQAVSICFLSLMSLGFKYLSSLQALSYFLVLIHDTDTIHRLEVSLPWRVTPKFFTRINGTTRFQRTRLLEL